MQASRRLKVVAAYAGSALVYMLNLSYETSANTGRSLLKEINLCNGVNFCKSKYFDYLKPYLGVYPVPYAAGALGNASTERWLSSDTNGDGYAEVLRIKAVSGSTSEQRYSFIRNGLEQVFGFPAVQYQSIFFTVSGTFSEFLVADFNGDGLDDVLRFANISSGYNPVPTGSDVAAISLLRSGPTGFELSNFSTGTVNRHSSPTRWTAGVQGPHVNGLVAPLAVDVNGDGRKDLVTFNFFYNHPNNGGAEAPVIRLYLANGTTFNYPPLQQSWVVPADYLNAAILPGDFNGDGLGDVSVVYNQGGNVKVDVYKSLGSSFQLVGNSLQLPYVGRYSVGDFNADGLTDLVQVRNLSGKPGFKIIYAAGDGGFSVQDAGVSDYGFYADNISAPDFNGDGLADLMISAAPPSANISMYRFDGVGFTGVANTAIGVNNLIGGFFGHNGANIISLAEVKDASGSPYLYSWYLNFGISDLLSGVLDENGLSEKFSYLGAPSKVVNSPNAQSPVISVQRAFAGFSVATPPPLPVVNATSVFRNGVEHKVTYKYENSLTELSSGRGFLGFGAKIEEDVLSGVKNRTDYSLMFPYMGMPAKNSTGFGGSLDNLSVTNYSYGCYDFDQTVGCQVAPGKRYFVYQTMMVETAKDLAGKVLPGKRTETVYDCASAPVKCFGNATKVTITTLNPDGTDSGYAKVTESEFFNDEANWRLGKVLRSKVTSVTP